MTKIAIHNRPGSFSDRWIHKCEEERIRYKVVNCHDSDIVTSLEDSTILMWHFSHLAPVDLLMARSLIESLQHVGKKVFPDIKTCWHFDDKVAQKYLLESIAAPVVNSYVFYDMENCENWMSEAVFPLVFKLRRGAGSANVKLVRNKTEAMNFAHKMFTNGIRPTPNVVSSYTSVLNHATSKGLLLKKIRRIPSVVKSIWNESKTWQNEKGYAYFQDYLPLNQFDTRVTVIGKRAFAFIRYVRPGDFRASGSGNIDYDVSKIDQRCVKLAFDVADKLGSQSVAFDFAFDHSKNPRILEISYCYKAEAVFKCCGHWDNNMNWRPGNVWPQDAILDDCLVS